MARDVKPAIAAANPTATSISSIALALIVAALVPAIFMPARFHGATVFVSGLHVLSLALPVFLLLGRPISWWKSLLGGALIAAVPATVLTLLTVPDQSAVGDVQMTVDGARTAAGWWEVATVFLTLGALGLACGFCFWLVLRLTDSGLLAPAKERMVSIALYVCVGALVTAAVIQARDNRDMSCHNLFRHGGDTFRPTVSIDLSVPEDQWDAVTSFFESFGATHGLQFRNSSSTQSSMMHSLYLSLCNEAGAVLGINAQHWKENDNVPHRGIQIGAYDGLPDSKSFELARLLVKELEARWPQKVGFRDGGGVLIPKP